MFGPKCSVVEQSYRLEGKSKWGQVAPGTRREMPLRLRRWREMLLRLLALGDTQNERPGCKGGGRFGYNQLFRDIMASGLIQLFRDTR